MVRGNFEKRPEGARPKGSATRRESRGRAAILVSGVLLGYAPAPMLLAEAEAMTAQEAAVEPERNKQIVATAFDRWAAGRSDFFNEMLAPDIVWTIEGSGPSAGTYPDQRERTMPQQHPYVGMWVTADGHIRQELLPNGRYDEARGPRKSAYQGRYEVEGNHINYWDDTGFTADGTFVSEDELHHGGMIFTREK